MLGLSSVGRGDDYRYDGVAVGSRLPWLESHLLYESHQAKVMPDQQSSLFDREPEAWELDEAREKCVARVVFASGFEDALDYIVPDDQRGKLLPGSRVRVPLGRSNRTVVGYCVAVEVRSVGSMRLKEIQRVVDPKPLLSQRMLDLTKWMSSYYLASWGKVIESVIPAGVREGAGIRAEKVFHIAHDVAEPHVLKQLPAKQRALFTTLQKAAEPISQQELLKLVGCTAAPLRALEKKGIIRPTRRLVQRAPETQERIEKPAPVTLHTMQQAAVDSVVSCLRGGIYKTFVLHGVTGSGKTEVYIRAIEETIQYGRQAIVLVPEISLTPQTRRRFRARFRNVAVLHSHLSDAERNWHWQRIASGEVEVIVGARSAVFAPTRRLGLIVLDEEHDGSFKQDSIPRYHARDVAQQRATWEQVPLILGSATPSLESWHLAQTNRAVLLSMPRRVNERKLPDVLTIDLKEDRWQQGSKGPISGRLQEAIRHALRRRQQSILLLNRRGFSTHIQCQACGHVVSCPACEIALTHHREGERAVCHYCEFDTPAPRCCPQCKFEGIRYGGLGTQRLEAEVRSLFPSATVLRMDSDTMRRHGSHEESLNRFRRGEVQILVGTQMIAKGLDFPNVTVVGVVNADTGLHLPDFRAAERTFQLITQVAGRTGRGELGGSVYLQTYNPDHPAIRAAERHDYLQFAAYELPLREQFEYPPYGAMIRLIVRGPLESQVEAAADEIAASFDDLVNQGACRRLGPAPAPIQKLRDNYRYHMILQAPTVDHLQRRILSVRRNLRLSEGLQWQADVDPFDML